MFNPMRLFGPLIVLAAVTPALAELQETPRTISTTGESLVRVAPDEVLVFLGVQTFNKDLNKATGDNQQQGRQLLLAIKELGIEDKHVQTDVLQVDVRYESHVMERGIDGYIARRGYAITLKKPEDFERLVETGLKNGANVINGFEFRTTELRKHRDQARKMAIQAAKEKAELLAAELNCVVGAPRSIQEGAGGYGYWGSRWNSNRAMSQNSMQDLGGAMPAGGEALPMGQIGVQAQVSVTFDLVPR